MNAPRDFKRSALENKRGRRRVAKANVGEWRADELSVVKGPAREFAVRWAGNASWWLLAVMALSYLVAKPSAALIGFIPIMTFLLLQWLTLAAYPGSTRAARPIPIADTHDRRARFDDGYRAERTKGSRAIDLRSRYSHRDGESK